MSVLQVYVVPSRGRCGVVWCGVVWCGVVWCSVMCMHLDVHGGRAR